MARDHGHRLSGPADSISLNDCSEQQNEDINEKPRTLSGTGWLLVAHPSYKLDQ